VERENITNALACDIFGLNRTACDIFASGAPKKCYADNKHEERKKLTSGEWTGQRRIRLSEGLADDAHDRIKKEETSGCHSVRFLELQPDEYHEREEQSPFKERLIELAWIAWRENAG
jgi:hypothetical protein